MRSKKIKIIFILLILSAAAVFFQFKIKHIKSSGEILWEVKPVVGDIKNVIPTTGIVLPKNRLEIKPPVNGRVENILVKEGEKVKAGHVLALMSSTERAALLDAARGEGEKVLKYWQEVYKAIPLISPIDGEVIVSKIQTGQAVITSEAVVVLSDKLIVRAQVDETDIGKLKLGQNAEIVLDAYPDEKIKASVEHIYYESKTVNNVTIYDVNLLAENIPSFFRSGMNAAINFIENNKENVLLIPTEAVLEEKNETYVLVKQPNNKEVIRYAVKLGISDDKNIEVLSGINQDDTIIIKTKKYILPKSNMGSNPFMPFSNRRREGRYTQ